MIGDEGAVAFAPHLGKLVKMKTLVLEGTRVVAQRVGAFGHDLGVVVRGLLGTGNNISEEGAAVLGPHLGKLVNILTLILESTLCCVLWCGCAGVTSVWLVWAGNELGDEGAATLVPHMAKLVKIKRLNLKGTHAAGYFVRHCSICLCSTE